MNKHLTHPLAFLLTLIAALSLAFVSPAYAEGPEKQLALELTRLVLSRDSYKAMQDQMITGIVDSASKSGAKLSPADVKKVKDAVSEIIPYDEMVQWNAEIYASKFTADELKEIIKFYSTPVGKKSAKLLPEISGEAGKKIGEIVTQRLPGALKKRGIQ